MIDRYILPRMREIWSEDNKYRTWLAIEIAACRAQHELGAIPDDDLKAIVERASFDVRRIGEIEAEVQHDVIAFLTSVSEAVGPSSRYIHLGMTSSDVLDTAWAVLMKQAGEVILSDLAHLEGVLRAKALEHKDTVMMGRTHGVHAEPVTFGLVAALWWQECRRNTARMESAVSEVACGKISGAVGTFAHIDPAVEEQVCRTLGLSCEPVSSQVVQRDRHAQFLSTLALVAASLEKIALEVRHLQRTEVREAEEPFAKGQKGSSAMPHKRNPIVCERICGLARLVRANAMVGLENVALWHQRDISHSSAERVVIPDSCCVVDYLLHKTSWLIEGLVVHPRRMLQNIEASGGLVYSQLVLLALIEKGLSREEAYRLVQRNAMAVWDRGGSLQDCLGNDPEVRRCLAPREIAGIFDLGRFTRNIDAIYRRIGLC